MWIVDRHPVHRSKLVQQWLHNHRDQIEKSFLPPYLPQLNPAEYLNCDVKQGVHFFATYPQLDSVKRAAAVTSIQTTKVTCSNRQVFPAMPQVIKDLAVEIAKETGNDDFYPQSCLINLYNKGEKLGMHQDNT
ncbi:MAG: alpha-ketoglutarate-dependent dioxygenase AlkB, partial [Tatlockia sp.]|nr:alpha-ketoglutarate-dependent dioxygenase AlkB [Tatlockia sp.]